MSAEEPRLPILRDAAERLSERVQRSDPNLPDSETLIGELEAVTRMVEEAAHRGDPASISDEKPSLLALQFLDLLRSEVLRAWPETDAAGGSSAADLLSVMRAFEAARIRLSPEDPHLLGTPVLDPWARRLLGEMAHTLGSSMGPMVMLTEVLASGESGDVNELQRSQLQILYRAALASGSMAVDLLRLAGPFEEPEEGMSGMFSVTELLDEVGSILGPVLEERGIESRIGGEEGARDARRRVGRPFALRRVLVSLSLASMTDANGGRFTLEAREEGDLVRFSILRDRADSADDPAAAAGPVFRERSQKRGWHISPPALAVASARHLVGSLGGELEVEETSESALRISFSVSLPSASGA